MMDLHSFVNRLDFSPQLYPVDVAFCMTNNHANHHKDDVFQFQCDNHVPSIRDTSLNSNTVIIINEL